MVIQELKQRDYDYWCSLVGHFSIKIFKDEIAYFKNGKEVYVSKEKLRQQV